MTVCNIIFAIELHIGMSVLKVSSQPLQQACRGHLILACGHVDFSQDSLICLAEIQQYLDGSVHWLVAEVGLYGLKYSYQLI